MKDDICRASPSLSGLVALSIQRHPAFFVRSLCDCSILLFPAMLSYWKARCKLNQLKEFKPSSFYWYSRWDNALLLLRVAHLIPTGSIIHPRETMTMPSWQQEVTRFHYVLFPLHTNITYTLYYQWVIIPIQSFNFYITSERLCYYHNLYYCVQPQSKFASICCRCGGVSFCTHRTRCL